METQPKQPRRSVRTPKRKGSVFDHEERPIKRSHRPCEKVGCPCERPSCFAMSTSGCAKDGYTARWYHLSNSEHFCNECFEYFYRSYKEGNQKLTDWKLKMAAIFQKELSIKLFFAEEILNYWSICSKCKKWQRAADDIVRNDIINPSWKCSMVDGNKCTAKEPTEVAAAKSLAWINSLSYLPLLKFSSPFSALNKYYPDGIGFSVLSTKNEKTDDAVEIDADNIQPFYSPGDAEKSGCFAPDIMLPDEREAFPELVKQPSIFFGLRNMAISLWNLNYKEYLSLEKCIPYVVVRGLARITLCEILKSILDFLTIRGRINFGIMSKIPGDAVLNTEHFKGSVIVIGAGFAGLSAALMLKRAGCKVKVLEARREIGGRVKDDTSLKICVSQGPQIITGCINNPIYIMCKQMGLPLRFLRSECNLISNRGEIVSESIDQKVEFYFNLMLESTEELKENERALESNLSLKDCLTLRKDDLEMQIFRELTKEEVDLLQFHLANLEYACGARLEFVSALHWNQNESMLQFGGEHAWVEKGFTPLVKEFAKNLDIQLNCEVADIDYSEDHIKVTDRTGKEFTADKVIVAVPLSVLKKETIRFIPALSDIKKSSISNLGAGNIEKVMLAFKKNFWKDKLGPADFFGRIPDTEEDRGFACLFYDVSTKLRHALVALVVGNAVSEMKSLSDTEVIGRCLEKLRNMFPDKNVPKPYKYFVSRWSREEHIEMTYSYVSTNGSGDDYDNLAESVDGKLYFAGEATSRRFPQTVSGAFISGIREARKVLTNKM